MMAKREVLDWLNTLPDDCDIAIDDGGLALVVVNRGEWAETAYCEVGGVPEEAPP